MKIQFNNRSVGSDSPVNSKMATEEDLAMLNQLSLGVQSCLNGTGTAWTSRQGTGDQMISLYLLDDKITVDDKEIPIVDFCHMAIEKHKSFKGNHFITMKLDHPKTGRPVDTRIIKVEIDNKTGLMKNSISGVMDGAMDVNIRSAATRTLGGASISTTAPPAQQVVNANSQKVSAPAASQVM